MWQCGTTQCQLCNDDDNYNDDMQCDVCESVVSILWWITLMSKIPWYIGGQCDNAWDLNRAHPFPMVSRYSRTLYIVALMKLLALKT